MKKLYSAIMIVALFLICTTAKADIFVVDDGTQLTVSWSAVGDAFYYEVELENLTGTSAIYEEYVFDPFIVINGLVYHDIYKITVTALDDDEDESCVGEKYITFALDETSGNCICNCPELPKKVLFGLVDENWWTAITVNNASSESQSVIINAGTFSKVVVVPSNSSEVFLLRELIEDTTPKQYPISYETTSSDIGISVISGIGNSFCSQN